ncbi:PKD domain protein [Owenweeksia hongkongensis DSM 17368]|uniref:PKD domain protein n=1 Tax=Owenweeksia hongkongensis (strain DSM 17368 / CIP 108786 / JCM 12287 / NRRL B-23963 / UST20020801) TaxID=926562 RepID=G8R1E8_OWEHD|nr:PKD domain-containing protein [Owenweeksia hongkongensis]AEV33891.1 PKD domain protein [Owenweeksia hongkongensis DSM 17368]
MKNLLLSFGLFASWISIQAQCGSLSPITLPFTEGFESYSGQVTQDSVLNCSPTYRWDFNRGGNYGSVSFDVDALMGNHAAALAGTSYTNDTSQVKLTVNLTSYTGSTNDVILSFFYRDNQDETHAPDKVWVRGSSTDSWIEILDWNTTANGESWTLGSFNLSNILTTNMQSFSATTQVLWSQYDGSTYANNDGFAIDEVMIAEEGCNAPTGLTTTTVSPGQVTLDWTSTGTNWEIAYDTTGMPMGTHAITSTKPYTITGLATAVNFSFYVREICSSNSNSQWSGPYSVLIPCPSQTAPFFDNFDSNPVNVTPDCWSSYSNETNPYAQVKTLGSPYSGSQQLALYSSSGGNTDTLYAITPHFSDLSSASGKEVSMRVKVSNTDSKLIIGTTSDASGKAPFNAIDTIGFTASNTYTQVFITLNAANGYNGTDEYVVLKHDMGGTYDYVYVDDFDYHDMPTCPKPVDVVTSNITSSAADISFDDRGGSPYEYIFGAPGFAQASGTVQSTSSNPFTVSGLNPMTTYEVLVRNRCSTNDTSVWSDPIEFTTECVPFAAPYFTDFESDNLDEVAACWDYYESYSSSSVEVEDYRTHNSGSQSLQLYNSYTTSDTLLAITPELAGLTNSDKQIRFYSQTSDMASYLVVGTMPSPGASTQFTALDTIMYSAPNTYQEYIVTLDAASGYNGTDSYVAFMHGMGTTADYIHIDDFNYENIPACVPTQAADITVEYSNYDSVFVSWIPGEGVKFNMEVGLAGFTPGAGAYNVTVGDTFAGIGGLSASTLYEIYIKDSCNSGWSPVVGPISFNTVCSPVVAPFVEGFQSGSIPTCWDVNTSTLSTNVLAFWKFSGSPVGGAANNGKSAGEFAWVDGSNPYQVDTLKDVTLVTPFIDISSLNVPQLYFELFSNNTTEPGDNVKFYINLWDGAQWNDSVFMYSGDNATWQDFTMLFNSYNITGPIQLEFVVDKTTAPNSSQNDFLLDSVVVQEAAPCPRPDHFVVTGVTPGSATFDLNAVNGVDYTLEWGPRGFSQGSGTGNLVSGITTLPYTLSSLNPNTPYDAYISVNCGPDGSSVWVGPVGFTTDCNGPLVGGTYTIGNGPTDDFPSFDTVASVLNACGISGPVVFNVQPGKYADALQLYSVAGVNSVNTITFNGSGSDTLEYNGVGAQATIVLDDVSHVTLSDLYIRNMSGTESWGVLITNESDSVTIDNSIIEVNAVLTSNDISPVLISGSERDDNVEGAGVDYFTLTNSTLIGGYSGLSLEGNGNANPAKGYVIENNLIKDYYIYGVYADDLIDVTFKGNRVESQRSSSSDGFYVTDIADFTFEANMVNVPDYGIYINDGNAGGVATTNSSIVNNMVISTGDNAVHLFAVENVNVFHNTFYGEAGYYMDNHISVDIRNNIFASPSDYAFNAADSLLPTDVLDYNLYYVGGAHASIRIDGNDYADLAAAQAAYSAKNLNSVEGDPLFVSATDLHVTGVLANAVGDNSVGVTIDIDNDARPFAGSTTVDMGADEFEPAGDDVGVIAIVDPQARNCGDSSTVVTVVIQNFGANTASNFGINVDVTGDATANLSTTYSGSLASLATDTVSLSSFNSILGGQFTIEAYTSLVGDQISFNDTVVETLVLNHAGEISIYASDSAVCVPQGVTLWADTNFTGLPLVWTDLNGNPLGTGDTLSLALVDSATSVVLSVDTSGAAGFSTFVVGAKDTTIGAASSFGNYTSWAPLISAYQTVVIKDMKIYPQNSGTLIVDIKDVSSGNIVGTATVQVTQTSAYQPVTVGLNLTVPPGDYELRANPASTIGQMLRNSAGGVYPYGDPSIFELTGQTFGSSNANYADYYYYFYNMTISSTAGCERPSSTFTIAYGNSTSAAFTSSIASPTANGVDVDFDASTSATDASATYTWYFGDGNTGTGIMPQHTYTANGTYNVKLVVDGTCGKDSLTQQVVIQGISIEENMLSRSLEVYPNPTKEKINLVFDAGSAQSAVVYVSDMTGKVLFAKEYNNMNGEFTSELSLENLPKGTYILNVNTDGLSAQRRIIKI